MLRTAAHFTLLWGITPARPVPKSSPAWRASTPHNARVVDAVRFEQRHRRDYGKRSTAA